jgi:hypothetical protein
MVVISAGFATTVSVTFNAAAMSPVAAGAAIGDVNIRAFVYDVPDVLGVANYDIVFSYSSGTGQAYRAWCVNGATGAATQNVNVNASGTSSASLTTVSGDMLFAWGVINNPSGTNVTSFGSAQVSTANGTGSSSASGSRFIAADALADAPETVSWTLVPSPGTEQSGVFLVSLADSVGGPTPAPSFGRYGVRGPVR